VYVESREGHEDSADKETEDPCRDEDDSAPGGDFERHYEEILGKMKVGSTVSIKVDGVEDM